MRVQTILVHNVTGCDSLYQYFGQDSSQRQRRPKDKQPMGMADNNSVVMGKSIRIDSQSNRDEKFRFSTTATTL